MEYRIGSIKQVQHRLELSNPTGIHDQYLVVTRYSRVGTVKSWQSLKRLKNEGSRTDSVEPMCDAQHRRRCKARLDRSLDHGVRLNVDTARRLILHTTSVR
jgi:hypothetical protein